MCIEALSVGLTNGSRWSCYDGKCWPPNSLRNWIATVLQWVFYIIIAAMAEDGLYFRVQKCLSRKKSLRNRGLRLVALTATYLKIWKQINFCIMQAPANTSLLAVEQDFGYANGYASYAYMPVVMGSAIAKGCGGRTKQSARVKGGAGRTLQSARLSVGGTRTKQSARSSLAQLAERSAPRMSKKLKSATVSKADSTDDEDEDMDGDADTVMEAAATATPPTALKGLSYTQIRKSSLPVESSDHPRVMVFDPWLRTHLRHRSCLAPESSRGQNHQLRRKEERWQDGFWQDTILLPWFHPQSAWTSFNIIKDVALWRG